MNAALRRLAKEGVARAEEAGNAYLYTLNREHLTAPALELLADVRVELERRLRAEIKTWEIPPRHASIFGSAARGDGDTRSDIDIFVVRPADVPEDDPGWREQLKPAFQPRPRLDWQPRCALGGLRRGRPPASS